MSDFQGFILKVKHFGEYGGLATFLTPKGIIYAYDKNFFTQYNLLFPRLKETLFKIEVAAGAEEHRFYLRNLVAVKQYEVPFDYAYYVEWLIALTLLTQKTTDYPDLFFKCYYRFMEQLDGEPDVDFVNFALIYIELHILVSIGSGDFKTHFDQILRLAKLSRDFHDNFLNRCVNMGDFVVIQEYIGHVVYDVFSWNKGFEVFKECLKKVSPHPL